MTQSPAIEHIGSERDALAGQVAVVTGAGRGIGREIARACAHLGAAVVIAEISAEGAETEHSITEAGGRALFIETDVSDEVSVANLARKTEEVFGPADILVNNAILCPVASVLEMDVALWDRVIAVNLRGTFLACRAFLPAMLERERGVIVNMVSTDAMPCLSAYIASKQGIAGFSQSLAAEVGERGVRVIVFGPGMVDTPGLRGAAEKLAPYLGMSLKQFYSTPIHPAYDGLMPAEDAGAATAYLVAALADDYHGEIIDGYTVLERAGFLKAAIPMALAGVEPVDRPPLTDQAETLEQAIALSEKLEAFIAETAAEYDKLPVFIRPIARRGFKEKAGQSVQDWMRQAGALTGQLRTIATGDSAAASATAEAAFRAEFPRLRAALQKLIAYCQAVPGETARFIKDEETLRTVAQAMAEREATIRSLLTALNALNPLS